MKPNIIERHSIYHRMIEDKWEAFKNGKTVSITETQWAAIKSFFGHTKEYKKLINP